jgi:hypothetical protein
MAGVQLVLFQLPQFQKARAIGIIVAEPSRERLKVDVEKRRLENVAEKNISGNRMPAEQVD